MIAVVALLIVAVPAGSMRLGLPDGSSEPADSTTYRADRLISEAFGPGSNATLLVTADLPAGLDADEIVATELRVARAIADLDNVAAVAPVAVSGDNRLAAFQVIPEEGPNGLAIGVLVDAFVVRLLLMPAIMHLLGRHAWWLPRWLDRILPNVDVEGATLERRHHIFSHDDVPGIPGTLPSLKPMPGASPVSSE